MKTRVLIIIGIIVVIAVSLSSFTIYESSTTTFITCDPRYTQIGGKCVLRNLEQKIEKVVADAEDDPNKIGQNYVRLAIDSDIFSYDEKLKVLEKYVKEKNISTPFTENVITGKQEFKSDEPITFTWKQFGIGHPCTDMSIQVQSKSYDKPFYEHESQRLCQVLDEDVPFLQTWTQDDFPDFPYCSELGEYVIKVKNMFGEFGMYHEYFCKGASVGNDVINTEPERTLPPLDKMTLFEDPLFNDPDKFIEISEKKDSKCFTTPSMNYFCYAKPRMYESGIGVSWLISNTTKISGELHFDNVNVGPSYFTMKNMTQIKGDTAKITFADNDYRVGNGERIDYEITDKFEFSTIIEKFDTFVAKCDNYEGTSVTVVQYLGITTIDGVDYFMTWHLNANSEAGIACDYPQIIQNSFDNDFGNIGYDRSTSYYPNKRPLPNGTFDNNLENVIPWLMMQELEKHGIENWKNDPSTRGHTDEGWLNPSKMCSSLFVDGETKLYISTSFYSEPELIVSEIIIDDSKPMDCQKWFWIPYGVNSKTGNLLYAYDEKSPREYYEIEITGLKDAYLVGEQYDFSYIISGYGNSCGSKTITFPDSNGDTIGSASSASCIVNLPMGMFVFDIQKEQGTTYGHVEMKNPGTYTVTVTFDRPNQYFPTTVSKEFRVMEN